MTTSQTTPAQRFARLAKTLAQEPAITVGSGRKGFGSSALQVNGRIFAMLSSREQFVVKLPKERVDSLVASEDGQRFDPGHGRVMKEWLALAPSPRLSWQRLAREALTFVGADKKLPRPK